MSDSIWRAQRTNGRRGLTPEGEPVAVREVRLHVAVDSDVLAEIRANVASGARTPVTADHMRALCLDDMLLEVAALVDP